MKTAVVCFISCLMLSACQVKKSDTDTKSVLTKAFVSEVHEDIPSPLKLSSTDLQQLKQQGLVNEADAQIINQYLINQ